MQDWRAATEKQKSLPSQVLRDAPTVVSQGGLDCLAQCPFRRPTKLRLDLCEISVVVAYVDGTALRREFGEGILAAAMDFHYQLGEVRQCDDFIATEIIDLPFSGRITCRQKKRGHGIFHIGKVALLFSTPDFNWLVLEQLANPETYKGLPRVFDSHPGSDRVG